MLLRLSPVDDFRGGPLLLRSMEEAVVEEKEVPLEEVEEEGCRERRPPCEGVDVAGKRERKSGV